MVSVISAKKKAMNVKIRELPSWKLMQDFTLKGIVTVFLRGYYQLILQVCQCEEKEHYCVFHCAGSLGTFPVLPFLQGA